MRCPSFHPSFVLYTQLDFMSSVLTFYDPLNLVSSLGSCCHCLGPVLSQFSKVPPTTSHSLAGFINLNPISSWPHKPGRVISEEHLSLGPHGHPCKGQPLEVFCECWLCFTLTSSLLPEELSILEELEVRPRSGS